MRTLDKKLANIQAGNYTPADFIIADAKDGDIGFGRAAPVRRSDEPGQLHAARDPPPGHPRHDQVGAGRHHADVGLDRASGCRTRGCSRAARSPRRSASTTPPTSGRRAAAATGRSRRATTAPRASTRPSKITDLGLYSVTFSNQRDIDAENAEAYSAFRAEAADNNDAALPRGVQSGLRHQADRRRRHRLLHQRQHRPHARRRDGGGLSRSSSSSSTTGRAPWRSSPPTIPAT